MKQTDSDSSRLCNVCRKPIPTKRLQAVPTADMCVSCLEQVGDVDLVRRFDEYVGEEQVSTYFTHNPYIQAEIKKQLDNPVPRMGAEDEARAMTVNSYSLPEYAAVYGEKESPVSEVTRRPNVLRQRNARVFALTQSAA